MAGRRRWLTLGEVTEGRVKANVCGWCNIFVLVPRRTARQPASQPAVPRPTPHTQKSATFTQLSQPLTRSVTTEIFKSEDTKHETRETVTAEEKAINNLTRTSTAATTTAATTTAATTTTTRSHRHASC
ncbi:hypothetical protein O3P69_016886 [Scylla paramamosain]|uniref:Uncharacterized protein n=1 Tax=Scylla paramamosain TaxID=85552 RepID=A0AAW0T132_SCYPA